MGRAKDRLIALTAGLGLPAIFFLGLELASRGAMVNPTFLPAPSAILATFGQITLSGAVVAPLSHTLVLLFVGYGIGCIAAICLGVLMGYSRAIYNLFEPLTELLRPIPKPALLPALILFLGLGAPMEVTIVALGTFFPVLINTIQGVRAVDPVMIDTARTFGHSTPAIWRQILLPASAPYVLAGMRISLGLALLLVVASEMLSGSGGLGDAILSAQRSFLVKESYAWLIVLALVGLVLSAVFNWTEKRVAFWQVAQSR